MVSVRWGGVRTDPYNPNPKDADLDGIVQEGTFFERPVGTRFINAIGRELLSGTPGRNLGDIDGMVLVDGNNRRVSYNPTWRSMRLTIAQRQRSIGQMNEPVGSMGTVSAPSMVRPVEEPPVEAPSALRPLNPWNIIEGGDRVNSPRYGEDTRQRVYGRLQTSDVDLEIVDNPDNGKFQIVGSYRDPDGDPEYFYDEYEFDSIEDAQEWGLTLSAILNNDDDDADDIRDAVDELLSSNIKDPTIEDVPRNPSSLSNEDLDNTIERLDELVSQTNDYTARMDLLDRLDLHLDEREKRYKRVREGRASRETTDRSVIDITPESIREDVGAHDWKQTRADRDSKKSELVEEVVERFWSNEEGDPWDLTAALEDYYRESLAGSSEEEIQQAIDFSKAKIASGEIEPSEIFSSLLTEEQREEHIRDVFLIGKRIDLGEKVASDGKSYRIVATPELEPQRIDEDFVQVSGRFNYEVYDDKGNLVGQYTPPVFGTHTDSGFHREIDLNPVMDDDGVARPSIFNVELGTSSTINFTNSDGESVSINTKGMGLADIFNANAFMFMEAMGVRRAKTTASSDGVAVWPRKGYVAQEDSEQVFETLERMTDLLNAYDEFKAGIVGGNFNSSFRIMAAAIIGDDERAERLRGMLKDFDIEKVKTYKVGEFDNIIDWDRYNEDNGVSFADVPQLGDFMLALENPDGSRNSLMYAAVHDSLVNYKKGKYDDIIQDAIDGIEDESLRTSVENVLDGATVNDLVNFGTLFYDGVMDLTPFKAKRPSDREGRASIAGFDENDTTLRGIVQTAQRLGKLVDLSKFREKFGERRRKKAGKGESLGSRVKVIPEGFSEEEQSGIAEAFDTLDSVVELPESMRDIEIQVVGRGSAIERDILLNLPIYDSNLNQYSLEERMRLSDEELAAGFDRYVFEFAGANAMFIPPYNEGEKGILVMRPMSMRGGSAQEQFIESYVGEVVLPDGRTTSGLYIGDILHEMVHAIDGSDKDIKDIDGKRDYGETSVMALAEVLFALENKPPQLEEQLTTNPSDLAYKISTNPGAIVDIARLYLPAEEFKKIKARDNRLRQLERQAGRELPASAGDPSLYLAAIFKKRLNDENVSLDPKTRAFLEFYTRASETGSFKDSIVFAGSPGYLASPHEILARGGSQYIALKALEKTGVDPRNYESFERDLKQLYSLAAKMKRGNLSTEERAVYDRLVQKVQQDWNDAFDELDDTQMNSLTTYLSLSAKNDQFSMLEMRDLTPFLDELMLNVGALPEEDDLPSRDVTPSVPPTRPPEAPPSGSIPLRPSFPSLTYSEDDYREMSIDELMKYTVSFSAAPLGPDRFDENALSVLEERVKELSDDEIIRLYRPQDGRIIGVSNLGQKVINDEFSKRGLLRLSPEEQREVLMENLRRTGREGRESRILDRLRGRSGRGRADTTPLEGGPPPRIETEREITPPPPRNPFEDDIPELTREEERLSELGFNTDPEDIPRVGNYKWRDRYRALNSSYSNTNGHSKHMNDNTRGDWLVGTEWYTDEGPILPEPVTFGQWVEDANLREQGTRDAVSLRNAVFGDEASPLIISSGFEKRKNDLRLRTVEDVEKNLEKLSDSEIENYLVALEWNVPGEGEKGSAFATLNPDDPLNVSRDKYIKHLEAVRRSVNDRHLFRSGERDDIRYRKERLERGLEPFMEFERGSGGMKEVWDRDNFLRGISYDENGKQVTTRPPKRRDSTTLTSLERWQGMHSIEEGYGSGFDMRMYPRPETVEFMENRKARRKRELDQRKENLARNRDYIERAGKPDRTRYAPPPSDREGRASRWDMFEGGSRVEDPVYSTDNNQKVFGKLQTEVVDLEILNNPDGEGFVVAGQYLDFDDEANDLDFSGFYEFDSIEDAEDWANGLEAVLQESIDGYDDFEDYEDRLDRVLGNEIYTGAGTFSERVREGRASKEYQESLFSLGPGDEAVGDDSVFEAYSEAYEAFENGEIDVDEFQRIEIELQEEALDARLSDFGNVYGDGAGRLIKDWIRDSYSTGFGQGEEYDSMDVLDLQAAINDFPEKDLLWRGMVLDPETRERMLESKKIRMPIGATADNDSTPLEYGGTGENGVLLRIEGANALPINKFSPVGSDDEWLVTGDFEIVSEGKHTVTRGQFSDEVNMWTVRPIRDGDLRTGRASARLEGGPPPAADEPAIVPPPQRLPFDASLNRRALEIDMTLTPELREQWDAERQRLIDLDIDPEMRERRMDQLFKELVRDNPDLVRTPPPGARPLGGDPDPLEGTFAYNERLGLPPPNVREGRASKPETGSQALAKVFADRWRKITEQRGMVSEKSTKKLKTMLPESNEGTAKFIEIEHEQNPVFSKAMKNTLDTMFLKMLLNPQYARITDDSKREKYIDENYSIVSYNQDLQELRGKLKEGGSLETNFVSNLNEDQKKILRKLISRRMAGRPNADPEALTDEEAKVFYVNMAQDAWAGTSQQFDLQLAAALESGMSDEDIIQSVFWQDFSKAEVYVATGDGKNPVAQTNLSNKEIGQLVLDAIRSDKMVVVQGEKEGEIKSVVIDPNSIPKAGSALLPQISFYDENGKLVVDTQLFGQGVNTFTFDKDTLAIHQGFLKARREQTIKNLKEAGITHVTLYRGMGDSAGVFEDGYDKGELSPLSSWSYRLGTATQFSSGEPNKTAVILEAAIPIEAIAGTSFDGFGCWTEEEVIVAAAKLDPELVGIKSFSLNAEGVWKGDDDKNFDLRGQNHAKNLALVEIAGRLFREAVSDPDYLSSEYEITQLANSVAAKYGLQGDANEILRYSPELREKVRKILSNISEGFVEDSLDIAGLQTSPQGFDTSES